MTKQDLEFTPVIWSLVQAYNESNDDFSQKKLKEALKDVIKKWTDQPVTMVSKKVLELSKKVDINPFDLMWPKREALGRDNTGKSILVWEHTTPNKEITDIFLSCKSLNDIKKAMSNYSRVCWITRDEDNRLTSLGYKSSRPGGWKKCYESAGIEIITK